MDIPFFIRGLIVGFSIAAPVGPIGLLCINRTLARGRTSGLVSGLGAATADAVYGIIAGLGLTLISNFIVSHHAWLRLVGGVFLCYLGLKTFLTRPTAETVKVEGLGLIRDYGSILFLTLTNPLTILSFAAVFAGLGLGETKGDYASATALVAGVFLGSALWWFLLSGGVGILRARFTSQGLMWVNRASGAVLCLFGVLALWSLV